MKLYTIAFTFFALAATAEGAAIPPVKCAKTDSSHETRPLEDEKPGEGHLRSSGKT